MERKRLPKPTCHFSAACNLNRNFRGNEEYCQVLDDLGSIIKIGKANGYGSQQAQYLLRTVPSGKEARGTGCVGKSSTIDQRRLAAQNKLRENIIFNRQNDPHLHTEGMDEGIV